MPNIAILYGIIPFFIGYMPTILNIRKLILNNEKMQESQLRIYKDIKNTLNQNIYDNKTRTLITLAYVLLSGYKSSIDSYVKMAISYGATKRDFLNVISCILGDMKLFDSIMELFRIIDDNLQEESKK